MNEPKRGPNGGSIDIDDPYEVPTKLRVRVRWALATAGFSCSERAAGRHGNADILLDRATDRLCEAITDEAHAAAERAADERGR